MSKPDHTIWMRRALSIAEHGAGHVSPNPLVGAVLVSGSGTMIGEGWHGEYGGAHAEVWAVRDAIRRGNEALLDQATLYVSLEPCSHFGKTPPCADLIVAKKIPRVVVAMLDPNPKVGGQGVERLREAGVDVVLGIMEYEAQRLNEPFVRHIQTRRPFIILKIAQTLDGRIATSTGDSRWITGIEAREFVHRMRAEVDAVLVGSGTAMHDNPALTVRHDWPGRQENDDRQPYRIVLDRKGMLPSDLSLFNDDFVAKTIVFTAPEHKAEYARRVAPTVLSATDHDGHLSLGAILDTLGTGESAPRIQSLMVEAGPGLATALIRQDLVDRFELFIAPKILGKGISAIGDLTILKLTDALTFTDMCLRPIGQDIHFTCWMRSIPGFEAYSQKNLLLQDSIIQP